MVEIQVAIDGERKDPEGRKKAKRRIGEEKARIVKKCDGDYLLCAGNVQTEKKAAARTKRKQNPVRDVARNPWARKRKPRQLVE